MICKIAVAYFVYGIAIFQSHIFRFRIFSIPIVMPVTVSNRMLFGRPFVKRFALCLSVLSVSNVGVLRVNGWMDQDETWHRGSPRTWPHCVRWRPSSPAKRGTAPPQFLAHLCCGQTAGWIKMPLGREVGLGLGHIVLDGDPAPPKGAQQPPLFGPCLLWRNG